MHLVKIGDTVLNIDNVTYATNGHHLIKVNMGAPYENGYGRMESDYIELTGDEGAALWAYLESNAVDAVALLSTGGNR